MTSDSPAAEPQVPAQEPAQVPAQVEVRRSTRRRRTVSAYREGDRIVVLIPASLSRRQEAEWVETMVARVEKAEARRLTRVRRLRYYPVRVVDGRIEVALPRF